MPWSGSAHGPGASIHPQLHGIAPAPRGSRGGAKVPARRGEPKRRKPHQLHPADVIRTRGCGSPWTASTHSDCISGDHGSKNTSQGLDVRRVASCRARGSLRHPKPCRYLGVFVLSTLCGVANRVYQVLNTPDHAPSTILTPVECVVFPLHGLLNAAAYFQTRDLRSRALRYLHSCCGSANMGTADRH